MKQQGQRLAFITTTKTTKRDQHQVGRKGSAINDKFSLKKSQRGLQNFHSLEIFLLIFLSLK